MRRAAHIAGGVVFAAALVLSLAPVGGFPSRPFVRSLGVGVAAPATDGAVTTTGNFLLDAAAVSASVEVEADHPRFCLEEQDQATGNMAWLWRANGGTLNLLTGDDNCSVTGAGTAMTIERTGTTVDSINLAATAVTINGAAIPAGALTAYKTVATDRASTTTFTSDPDLTFALAASTRYLCHLVLKPQGITTGTQGFKWAANYSGTLTDTPTDIQLASINGAVVTSIAQASTNSHAHATISVASADLINAVMSFQTNASGTFAIQWAQNSSNANATRLNRASALLCEVMA